MGLSKTQSQPEFTVEYVGGKQGWRWVPTQPVDRPSAPPGRPAPVPVPKPLPTCPRTLHPTTAQGGWGPKTVDDECASRLGYRPGLPRRPPPESSFRHFPSEWRVGTLDALVKRAAAKTQAARDSQPPLVRPGWPEKPGRSHASLTASSPETSGEGDQTCKAGRRPPAVEMTLMKDVRILRFPGSGDRLLVQRWKTGHAWLKPTSSAPLLR
eukprot:TRINITY_DN2628_c0_g1_i3.p1 TRINITY_DN2628_c0_g1~~TRINITY_DN2628_c0_g1_i3.p1  ORF type:complete len:211 (-),score=18.85 TRINITY_DN2628_c0_g1_i3:77-709(-)